MIQNVSRFIVLCTNITDTPLTMQNINNTD